MKNEENEKKDSLKSLLIDSLTSAFRFNKHMHWMEFFKRALSYFDESQNRQTKALEEKINELARIIGAGKVESIEMFKGEIPEEVESIVKEENTGEFWINQSKIKLELAISKAVHDTCELSGHWRKDTLLSLQQKTKFKLGEIEDLLAFLEQPEVNLLSGALADMIGDVLKDLIYKFAQYIEVANATPTTAFRIINSASEHVYNLIDKAQNDCLEIIEQINQDGIIKHNEVYVKALNVLKEKYLINDKIEKMREIKHDKSIQATFDYQSHVREFLMFHIGAMELLNWWTAKQHNLKPNGLGTLFEIQRNIVYLNESLNKGK